MQHNLINKIYTELDMIRLLIEVAHDFISQESEMLQKGALTLVLDDIEKRSISVSKMVEKSVRLTRH